MIDAPYKPISLFTRLTRCKFKRSGTIPGVNESSKPISQESSSTCPREACFLAASKSDTASSSHSISFSMSTSEQSDVFAISRRFMDLIPLVPSLLFLSLKLSTCVTSNAGSRNFITSFGSWTKLIDRLIQLFSSQDANDNASQKRFHNGSSESSCIVKPSGSNAHPTIAILVGWFWRSRFIIPLTRVSWFWRSSFIIPLTRLSCNTVIAVAYAWPCEIQWSRGRIMALSSVPIMKISNRRVNEYNR
mmetsp:Transcript_44868/g.94128  ORF Transcript_44868/g.94128 Transcript_44868/m.94128 type:complete len:247 (-) Transcript_44868:113-853(-)